MEKIKANMLNKNNYLSSYACLDTKAIRLYSLKEDFRPDFYRDIDKIIYSLSFVRYKNKTQVFTFQNNDHLSKRMIHVIYVSKIARTIGRALGLNEDLIEAAALGHDLGHTPFGHVGESVMNEISISHNEGYFHHNIESVRLLLFIENYGKGHNITLQVLDAIMAHNGEIPLGEYHPVKKSIEEFWKEYYDSYKIKDKVKEIMPMTLEGCVVRVSDMIAYLGRDLEDGIRLGLITLDEIPINVKKVLGTTNAEIVDALIRDILKNSIDKNYIKFSDNVYKALLELKDFNYENIYYKAYTKEEKGYIKDVLYTLFNQYIEDLKSNNRNSNIIKSYLDSMDQEYLNNTNERIVIDYIAGMTDEYCIKEYNKMKNISHNKKEVENEV